MNKFCPKCNTIKPKEHFYKSKNRYDGLKIYCIECQKKSYKKYYLENRNSIIIRTNKYSKSDPIKTRERIRKYRARTKEKWKKWNREYMSKKKKLDISFKIRCILSSRITNALKGKGKSQSTKRLLGCSLEEFKKYIESKFEDNMTWNNYGEWELDHIRPCASFDLINPEEQSKCFHFTNIQPLWETTDISIRNGSNKIGNKNKKNFFI
jgi:hypothetical protein